MKIAIALSLLLSSTTLLADTVRPGENLYGPGYEILNISTVDSKDGQGEKLRRHEMLNISYWNLSECQMKKGSFARKEYSLPVKTGVPMRSNTIGVLNPGGAWVRVEKTVGEKPAVQQKVAFEFTVTQCYTDKSYVLTESNGRVITKIKKFIGAPLREADLTFNQSYGIATGHHIYPLGFTFERKQAFALQDSVELNSQIEKQSLFNIMAESQRSCEIAREQFIKENQHLFSQKESSDCRNVQGTLPAIAREYSEFLVNIESADQASQKDLIPR
ncbi:MAG: hypothetical protein KUL82_06895 [Bdellovibrio sp.]|nr:hypothetical protein [Bdellovibrio sp.]